MKKLMFMLIALLMSGSCLALYTLTGTAYYGGTSTGVPNASLHLTGGGCTVTGTADVKGRFTLQCSSNPPKDSQMILTATAPAGFFAGQRKFYIPQSNTQSQNKNVYLWPTIQPGSSFQMPSISTNLLGTPGTTDGLTVPFQVQLAAPGPGIQVQNAQINIVFNGPIVGAPSVVSVPPDVTVTSTVPIPGGIQVGIEVDPPRNVPEFPAESFFDVFFEVEIPESGAKLAQVTIEEAKFNELSPDVFEFSGIPSLTEHLIGEYEPPSPYFLIDSQDEWQIKLDAEWPDVSIRWLTLEEGEAYLAQIGNPVFLEPGSEPYSPTEPVLPEFIPSELYVWEGDDDPGDPDNLPDDAGLVME